MVTLEEARTQLEQQKQATATAKAQLETLKQGLPQQTAQSVRQPSSALTGKLQRGQIESKAQAITSAQQEVSQYQEGVLTPAEQEIANAEQEIKTIQAQNEIAQKQYDDYKYGYTMGLKGRYTGNLTKTQREGYYDATQGLSNLKYSKDVNKEIKAVEEKISQINLGAKTYDEFFSPVYIEKLKKMGIEITSDTSATPEFSYKPTGEFGRAGESYNSQIGMFQSVSPTGASGTAYWRTPTPEEKYQVDYAKYKGSYSQLPPIKFFRGEYPFQQKTLHGTPINYSTSNYREYVGSTPIGEIYKSGNYPAVVLKSFQLGGEQFFKGSEAVRIATLGGKPSSPSQIKLGGEVIGEVGMWGFFAPAISTGATGIKQKTIKVSGNKFKLLEDFYANVEKGLLERTKGKEQTEFLAKVYKEYFKGKPKGKEGFQSLLDKLAEKEIYKGVPIEYFKAAPKPKELFTVTLEVPIIRDVGKTGAVLTTQELFSQNQFGSIGKVNTGLKINKKYKISTLGALWIGKNILSKELSAQINKQESKQVSGLSSLLGIKSLSGQANRFGLKSSSTLLSKQVSISKSASKSLTSQLSRLKLKEKLKEKSSSSSKFGFLLSKSSGFNLGGKNVGTGNINVFGRRKGKDILLGQTQSQAEAEAKLRGFLTGTLGASGFLEKGGRKLKVNLGRGFAPSKLESLRVIQLKTARFGTRSETKEAQSNRRFFRR